MSGRAPSLFPISFCAYNVSHLIDDILEKAVTEVTRAFAKIETNLRKKVDEAKAKENAKLNDVCSKYAGDRIGLEQSRNNYSRIENELDQATKACNELLRDHTDLQLRYETTKIEKEGLQIACEQTRSELENLQTAADRNQALNLATRYRDLQVRHTQVQSELRQTRLDQAVFGVRTPLASESQIKVDAAIKAALAVRNKLNWIQGDAPGAQEMSALSQALNALELLDEYSREMQGIDGL